MAVPAANESGIKALIFDCFGVLYVGSLSALYDETPREKWGELHDLSIGSDYGYISRSDYLTALSKLTGRSYDDIAAQQTKVHVRNDALVAYIRELHKTYKIGLLSNVGFDLIESLFTVQERAELFDAVVLSSEEGIVKPHPRIFEIAAERLGVPTGDCVMVDDLEKNIEGADAAGMRGIVYSNVSTLQHDLATLLANRS